MAKQNISPETEKDAMAIAKATQKPGQTKEQTKLIAKGIEKGIAEYKKRQKAQKRDLDKKRKKLDSKAHQLDEQREEQDAGKRAHEKAEAIITTSTSAVLNRICYFLLFCSLGWIIFHQINFH